MKTWQRLLVCFVFILALGNLRAQSPWYVIHENSDFVPMRSAMALNPDLRDLYAVGDQGMFFESRDHGYTWNTLNIGTTQDLKQIAYRYSYSAQGKNQQQISKNSPSQLIAIQRIAIICGSSGTLVRFDLDSKEATFIDTLTSENLNTVVFDFFRNKYWLAGENGFFAFSEDDGETWHRFNLNPPRFNIKKIDYDYSYLLLMGDDGQDTYLKKLSIDINQNVREVGTDTIPNQVLVTQARAGGGNSSESYFITRSPNDSTLLWSYNVYDFPNFNYYRQIDLSFADPTGMALWSDYASGHSEIWVSTAQGQIWKLNRLDMTWVLQFQDAQNRALGPIIPSDTDYYDDVEDAVNGVVLGSGGITVFNGFIVLEIIPHPGELISGPINQFSVKFSNIPDLVGLAENTFIKSNLSGMLPFTVDPEPGVANQINFTVSPLTVKTGVPGETWQCTFAKGIHASGVDSLYLKNLTPFHFEYGFFTAQASSFEYGPAQWPSILLDQITTNWVAGFFNADDYLDLVTYTQDSLVILMSQNSVERTLKKIYVPGINPDLNIKKQLKIVDLNHDVLPDLLLYDTANLHLLVNNSLGTDVDFRLGDGYYSGENIKDVIPYNENNNTQPDLLILDNDIFIIKDIDENLIDQTDQSILISNATTVSRVQIGDIDGDRIQDLVFLDNGTILYRKGDPQYGLTGSYYTDTLMVSDYTDFALANIDNMPPQEIICLGPQRVEAISYPERYHNEANYLRFLFSFSNPTTTDVSMSIDELGGDLADGLGPKLDIALLKNDSLLIYQNITNAPGQFVFSEVPVFKAILMQPHDQLFTVDYATDGLPEMALGNRANGFLDFWEKGLSWIPELTVDSLKKYEIQLSWSPFPTDLGTLDYYELERSHDPAFIDGFTTYISNEPFFIDHDVWPFEDYWYRVKAYYNGGQITSSSDAVHVKTYRELSGILNGVLSDTTLPYLVLEDLMVPAGDSLQLLNGVDLAFLPNTGLNVEGSLLIKGNNFREVVELYEVDSLWKGINLKQNPDTAHFECFAIHGAQTAISAEARPLKISLGGIIGCPVALQLNQVDFWMKNFIIDSTFAGIRASDDVNGFVKNIDLFHARDFSVFASGNSVINIKNAIIWNNLGPLTAADSAKIFLSYSTVDNIGQRVFTQHISKLAPVFEGDDSSDPFNLSTMSPTIDAGDPDDPYELEPQPNGGRINQGTLGGTPMALPSLQPRIAARFLKTDLKTFATGQDSTDLVIKNWGYIELNIDSLVLKAGAQDSVFILGFQGKTIIPAQDSMVIPVRFRPPKRGIYQDSLVILCNDPHLLAGRYVMQIHGECLNSKPVLFNEPPTIAFVDSVYYFKPLFSDLDGDSIVVQAPTLPGWLKRTAQQALLGSPSPADTGRHEVRLRFSDQHGGQDSLRFFIDVVSQSQPVAIFPVIKAHAVGGALSKQAAINIVVSVWDSSKTKLKEATQSYHLIAQLFKKGETEPLQNIDTTGVRNFYFYPLEDGDYRCRILATKVLADGRLVEGKTELLFAIRASLNGFARFRWHMMAFPRQEPIDWSQFNYSDSSAVLFRWDASEKKYFSLNKEEKIEPGMAFWLMPLQNLNFDLNPIPIAESSEAQSVAIHLKKGWNQVGLPWPYYKHWTNLRFSRANSTVQLNLQEALNDTLIQPAAFWFEQRDDFIGYHVENFDSASFARPWFGYWLYANTEATMFVDNVPEFPRETDISLTTPERFAKRQINKHENDWSINFSLQCDKLKDEYNLVGLSDRPAQPIFEPPVFNEFAALTVTEGDRRYCQYFKPRDNGEKSYDYWDLSVTTSAVQKEHHLSWQQISGQNEELFAYLVDLDKETVIKLWENDEYIFTPQENTYHFRLYVSKDRNFEPSIIPLQFTLAQNFPNPFNPTTTIKIGVPETGSKDKISVKIFDVLGKEVRVLFEGNLPPGFHQFEWDGTNATGDAVASGIYFYQLQAGHVSMMRKMVLLR